MINSWALDRPLSQPFNDFNQESLITTNQSAAFSYTTSLSTSQKQQTNIDTLSMNINQDLIINGYSSKRSQYPSIDRRNKYNTLTPAEAKKMKRFLNAPITTTRNQPTRTASVLHKPRAPPLLVPDENFKTSAQQLLLKPTTLTNVTTINTKNGDHFYDSNKISPTSTINDARCGSACSNRSSKFRDQRHSINYGQLYAVQAPVNSKLLQMNGQTIVNNNNVCDTINFSRNNNKCSTRVSPSDSETNLSFRSSLDVMDSAYGSDRLQTLSVDLGNPTQQYFNHNNNYLNEDNNSRRMTLTNGYNSKNNNNNNNINNYAKYYQDSCSQELNKLSDDSYSSAKSHQSESRSTLNNNNNSKSISKNNSLSSSTSKVFQNHLGNIKRFFRHMPIRRSFLGSPEQKSKQNNYLESKQDLSESISQICLNRSQSPPICPPPPGELKSMSYMESNSLNYSNYDEFTKARNQQTSILLQNNSQRNNQDKNQQHNKTLFKDNENHIQLNDNYDYTTSESSWQLQSLPISYERNLTTVFEEKQNSSSSDMYRKSTNDNDNCSNSFNGMQNNSEINLNSDLFIDPPSKFHDKSSRKDNDKKTPDNVHDGSNNMNTNLEINKNNSNSSESLTTTTDSVLDYHRQTGTSFRFSYGQPNASVQDEGFIKSNGLPPRMPNSNEQSSYNYQNGKQQLATTNGHSSSNNSLTKNGINNCDQKSFSTNNDRNSIKSLCDQVDYGLTNGFDNDGDTTILSDTSTLNGDSNNMVYINRCSELERTVESLKNKLITKEKEMTELQLKQWSSDYLISQLKSTIVRLEKENAQLKSVVIKYNKLSLT